MAESISMTQLNVRIPTHLKEQGTEALASIGLSPSTAVRALWEKASKRGKDLEELSVALTGNADSQSAAQADDAVARGHALWGEYLANAKEATHE